MSLKERRDRAKLLVFRLPLRVLAAVNAYGLLARYCARHVTELVEGRQRPASFDRPREGRHTVLVLDYERFRGDVDIFAEAHDIRVLVISWSLLRHLLASFVYEPTLEEETNARPGIRWQFALAEPGSRTYRERKRYRRFLRKFLPHFLEGLGVDIIMNSDFRYRREIDFKHIASELGYRHICYYREAMYIVPAYYDPAVDRHKVFSPFHGDIIAVQNPITKNVC